MSGTEWDISWQFARFWSNCSCFRFDKHLPFFRRSTLLLVLLLRWTIRDSEWHGCDRIINSDWPIPWRASLPNYALKINISFDHHKVCLLNIFLRRDTNRIVQKHHCFLDKIFICLCCKSLFTVAARLPVDFCFIKNQFARFCLNLSRYSFDQYLLFKVNPRCHYCNELYETINNINEIK